MRIFWWSIFIVVGIVGLVFVSYASGVWERERFWGEDFWLF